MQAMRAGAKARAHVMPARKAHERPGDGQSGASLSHVDARGRVKMVDVGDKPVTAREAIARGSITMSSEARRQIRARRRQEGRSAAGGAPRRHHGRQADRRR